MSHMAVNDSGVVKTSLEDLKETHSPGNDTGGHKWRPTGRRGTERENHISISVFKMPLSSPDNTTLFTPACAH